MEIRARSDKKKKKKENDETKIMMKKKERIDERFRFRTTRRRHVGRGVDVDENTFEKCLKITGD